MSKPTTVKKAGREGLWGRWGLCPGDRRLRRFQRPLGGPLLAPGRLPLGTSGTWVQRPALPCDHPFPKPHALIGSSRPGSLSSRRVRGGGSTAPTTFLGSITTPLSWPTTSTMPLGSLPSMQTGKEGRLEQSLGKTAECPLSLGGLHSLWNRLPMLCILGFARQAPAPDIHLSVRQLYRLGFPRCFSLKQTGLECLKIIKISHTYMFFHQIFLTYQMYFS